MVEHLDAEQLAAFLDGTLPPAERAEVMKILASNQEAYREFLEAQALLAELDAPDDASETSNTLPAPAPSPASVQAHARNGSRTRYFLFAAPILAAAALSVVLLRPDVNGASATESMYAAMLPGWSAGSGAVEARLGVGWNEPPWSSVRGTEDALSRDSRAFRLGVRLAELEVAVAAEDTVAAQQSLLLVERVLESVDLGAPVSAEAAQVRSSGTYRDGNVRRRLVARTRAVTGVSYAVDLGMWLGAARLAALGADTAFFATNTPAHSAWREVREHVVNADSAARWSGVVSAVDEMYDARQAPGADRALALVERAFSALPR